jgi:hypothetical protein
LIERNSWSISRRRATSIPFWRSLAARDNICQHRNGREGGKENSDEAVFQEAGRNQEESDQADAIPASPEHDEALLPSSGSPDAHGGHQASEHSPPVKPVARIKGNSVPGGKGALYCSVLGDMADTAVDEMEQAIIKDDEAALQKAIEDFRAAWDDGHSNGCYFTYV